MKLITKILRRLTRRSWNHTVHEIALRLYNEGKINSYQLHEITGLWNKKCWPEWSNKKS